MEREGRKQLTGALAARGAARRAPAGTGRGPRGLPRGMHPSTGTALRSPEPLCHPNPCVTLTPRLSGDTQTCPPRPLCVGRDGDGAIGQPHAPLPHRQSCGVSRYPCFCQQRRAPPLLINMHSPGIKGREIKPLFVFASMYSHLKILMFTFACLLFKLVKT